MYTIEKDGDYWEKKFHPQLVKVFPSYDVFWQAVVVPMTMRDINNGIDLRPNVARILELLAMSHYSCYYHLGVASELLDSVTDKPYLFDDAIFHLDTACEMIADKPKETRKGIKEKGRFLVYCKKVWEETGMKIEHQWLDSKLGLDWITKKAAFDEIAREVHLYRNAMAHNPKLAQVFVKESDKFWIPDKISLHKNGNMTWSDVSQLMAAFPSNFVERNELAHRLMTDVPSSINALWPELINVFEYLSSLDNYQKLSCTGAYAPAHSKFITFTSTASTSYTAPPPKDIDLDSTSGSGIWHHNSLNDLK